MCSNVWLLHLVNQLFKDLVITILYHTILIPDTSSDEGYIYLRPVGNTVKIELWDAMIAEM